MNRFLSALALIMILANAAGHLAAAWFSDPGNGPGWYGLYFCGQAAVLLAVWFLAADRRTCVYLILAAAFSALSLAFLLWLARQDPALPELFGGYVIFCQWLPAALCAASAAGRRVPENAPDLGLLKLLALLAGAGGLALRAALFILPAEPAAIPQTEAALDSARNLEMEALAAGVLLWFIPPLWLMRAAGRRPGPVFAAGLAMVLPLLTAVWFLLADRMEQRWSSLSLLEELARFDRMTLDLLLGLFILTALMSLAALVRVRRGGRNPNPWAG